jgi:molybdate transport system substrate-binding protein
MEISAGRALWSRGASRRLIVALLAALIPIATAARAEPLVVFAAASLKNALDEVAASYGQSGGSAPSISYGASSALARQLENGAPADLFISADVDWMDYVASRNLMRTATRVDLLANTLVLVAPKAEARPVELKPGTSLAARLHDGRLAIADPDFVPAGKYGKAALQSLSLWDEVSGRLAPAENVRAALAFVARGEAPLGIVYGTDAAAEPGVVVVATFPPESHPPIVYPASVTATSRHPEASAFLRFLASPASRAAFERQGFRILVDLKPNF